MKKTMTFVCLTLAILAFSAAFADGTTLNSVQKNEKDSGASGLYTEIPDKGFPVPMLDGAPIPYKRVALPEEGYEATSYVYTVSGTGFMESYKAQLKKAGFVDQGKHDHTESFWRYDRKSDGLALFVEMAHEESDFCISMYVNKLSQ